MLILHILIESEVKEMNKKTEIEIDTTEIEIQTTFNDDSLDILVEDGVIENED